MPVRELVGGIAGTLLALLATWILARCLVESRQRYGQTERGILWLPGKSWSKSFSPIWHPVLMNGAINMVVGYLLAGEVTDKRSALFAVSGALLAVVLAKLLGSPLPRLYGTAGQITVYFCELFFAFAGAYAGASLSEKIGPWKRKRKKRAAI